MDFKCVVCETDIKEISEIEPSLKSCKPEQGMYSNGVVDKIAAGYGSLLDGNMHIIAICDKCLNEKTLKGITPFVGDYMRPEITDYMPLKGE